jgi:N-acetylglucosaminyl-diphospho-decaprenol L-rhamnosyltransferase
MMQPTAETVQAKHQPDTLVVIVNYRVGRLVVETLASLKDQVTANGVRLADVVVIDNQSGDDSVAVMQAAIQANHWGDWARVIESPVNGGFAFGNNEAVREAWAGGRRYDFYWLLNPDTLARPRALEILRSFAKAHPRAGLIGSGVEDDEHGTRWPFAFRFHNVWNEFDQALRLGPVTKLLQHRIVARRMGDTPDQAEWLSGCSLLVRHEVFEQIGLMDEAFFLYYEETDFCRRAADAGWQRWYVPDARVFHMAGKSTGASGEGSQLRRVPAYMFESRRRYFVKHHGRAYAAVTDALWMVGYGLWQVRRVLQRKANEDPPHYFGDFVRHSALLNWRIPVNTRLAAHHAQQAPANVVGA